ncbi:Batten's disease protein Cln3 [Xylaria palmicola]|nr:Batten's disease protein Cln3 [Xylaria palmicola]
MPGATCSPASSGLLPMPGSPSASWALYRARLASALAGPDVAVVTAFWLFGLINNVLFVVILSAAQDLVGSSVPKGLVLLADVLPSFLTKLVAPYFIDRVPYAARVVFFAAASSAGMLAVALAPPSSVAFRMAGVMLASVASGAGELSFLGLTHYYGRPSLAAWGSGTGAAGLVGAGLYVVMTDWLSFSVRNSLLASAYLPVIMLVSFFLILPRSPLREAAKAKEYQPLPDADEETGAEDVEDVATANAASSLLAPGPSVASAGLSNPKEDSWARMGANLRRARALVVPYMLPLFVVYVSEYIINQGVSPTLLFPLESSPFNELRDFYPMYGFLYQVGVFVSRTSIAFFRFRQLHLASLLQFLNLVLFTLQSLYGFIPSVYIVFVLVFWEGLLGGGVYVNTFAAIMENVPREDREFSLGATSVSDSGGICVASFVGMVMETWLCNYQVRHGRDWCKKIEVG